MGLLGRAKNLMQGWSAPSPSRAQSFSVACSEGHRLQGQRTEGYQALRCPTCGEGIFVLPRSPLPDPPAPSGSSPSRLATAIEANFEEDPIPLTDPIPPDFHGEVQPLDPQEDGQAEIDWVDEVPADAPPVASKPTATTTRPVAATHKPRAMERSGPVLLIEDARHFSLREWGWRHRNRLLIVGLLFLVSSAVGIRRWRQRLESLPQVAEIGRTTGLKKLDDGDFQSAKKLLADAAAAVDSLGGTYQGAESIRQGAKEAAIFTDLATDGLDQILENASTFREINDWPAHFDTFYKGRSVILEAVVTAVPVAGKAGSRYQIGTVFFTGRGPKPVARAKVDVSGLRLFELSEPKVGDLKTFGARLASLELDPTTGIWTFALEPDSGVFMTHPKALEKVFGPPESTEEGQQ